MPEISVVMGVYNQFDKEMLLKSVNSIINQTIRDFEFIIYDDGSEPVASSYLKEVAALDERIILIGYEQNHGLAFSLNECIKVASGKYIARMDADDISDLNRLRKQKEYLDEHLEFSWCGTNAFLFDKNGVWGQRTMPKEPKEEDYLKYSPYIHPSVMYRSDIFEKAFGYKVSDITARCEDYELFARLRRCGFRGCNIQENLFYYREDLNSFKKRKMKHRINEAKVRYHNYKTLHILFPFGWMFVLRPILAGLLPDFLIRIIKRKESHYEK